MSQSATVAPPADAPVAPAPDATQTVTPEAPALGDSLLADDPPAAEPAGDPAPEPVEPEAPAAPDYSALKLPEGLAADDPLFTDFTAVAAEHKLTPEAAQSLIDKVLPGITKQIADLQAEPVRLATERLSEWTKTVMADPEIGGAKLAEVKTTVARAMASYGNPDEIKAALNETGAGSNPVLIRWFNRMASALSEGSHVPSGGVPGKKSGPEVFYDHPTSSQSARE